MPASTPLAEAIRQADESRARAVVVVDHDSKPIAILANICSAQLQIGTVNADGTVSDTKPIDAAAVFKS